MMNTNKYETFKKELLKVSNQNNYEDAKNEWVFFAAEEKENNCICGQNILHNCIMENKISKQKIVVGSCCVQKFFAIEDGTILFSALKKLRENLESSISHKCVDLIFQKGIFDNWQRDFYSDILRKRKLSDKQLNIKVTLNRKVLKYLNADEQSINEDANLLSELLELTTISPKKRNVVDSINVYFEKNKMITLKQKQYLKSIKEQSLFKLAA